ALAQHREELSNSLLLARRWAFLGERLVSFLPLVALSLGLTRAWLALLASRRVARGLARPIPELVDWAGRLAADEPIPAPSPEEDGEVQEVRVLRSAFRRASDELVQARERALEAERLRVWGEM